MTVPRAEPELDRASSRESTDEKRPILVTGMPRSGTSWIGKILDASGQVVYINEPLNPRHPPGGSPGVLRAPVRHRFQYINEANESEYLTPFQETLGLRYHVLDELRQNRSPYDLLRMVKYSTSFIRGRLRGRRPLLDDPYAVLSAEWFATRLGCTVVAVVRHPAAIASSRKRLGYTIDLGDLLGQPLLLHDWLEPFRPDLERMDGRPKDVVGQSSLLWRIIYSIVARQRERSERFYVVRHEDVSVDPVGEFARLYDLLGLSFSEKVRQLVIQSSTGNARTRSHSWSLSRSGISRTGFRPLDSRKHVDEWKRELSAEETARVRDLTGDVAREYYADAEWE